VSGVALVAGVLTVSGLAGCAVTRVASSDIKVVFVTPPIRPMPDVVRDPSDPALFRTDGDTEAFLRRPVTIPRGSTTTFVPWAQMLGVPSVAALVEHTEGHRGSWHIWAVVVAVLDRLAFDERSACRELAMQMLEEYWVPNALYRRRPETG